MRNCTPDQMRRPEHFPTWSWDPPCRKTWENRSSRDLIPRWNLEPKQSHFTAFMGAEQLQEHWRACRLASCPPPSSNCFQPFRASHQPHRLQPASSLHLLIGGPPGVLKAAPSASDCLGKKNQHWLQPTHQVRGPGTSTTGMPPVLFHQRGPMHATCKSIRATLVKVRTSL